MAARGAATPLVLTVLLAAAVSAAPACTMADRGAFAPPPGRSLLMVGQDLQAVDAFVGATGIMPAGVMTYTSIQQLQGLDTPVDYGAGVQQAQRLLERYPHGALQIGLWMIGGLEPVQKGVFDERIDRLGRWITRAKRPVYLRIGYEFDYPANGYQPAAYVAAFRRIVERMRASGVPNAAFVWHSYAGELPSGRTLADWYPGDDVVDWVGLSYFKVEQEPYRQAVVRFAREHGKPLMIAESAPMGQGTEQGRAIWDAWFVPWLRFIDEAKPEAVCYINNDWDALPMFKHYHWGDARIERDPDVLAAWIAAIRERSFLSASPDLFRMLGYQPRSATP